MSAKFWEEFVDALNIQHRTSTARHQQSNGQAEAGVKVAKRILGKLRDRTNKSRDWPKLIPFCEFAINNSVATSTGFSPYFLTFGSHPRVFPDESLVRDKGKTVHQFLKKIKSNVIEAQLTLQDSHEQPMISYNKHRSKAMLLNPGDLVLMESAGIKWPASGSSKQERDRWIGPVENLKGPMDVVNYQVKLTPNLRF
jgi:hypothetical protein